MTKNKKRALQLKLGAAIIALTAATPAWAQTAPEATAQAVNEANAAPPEAENPATVIVTATKRASTLQEVPFSINAQTSEDIQRANASTIEDISRNVAGLTVQNLGPGQSQVSVRGVSAGQIIRDQPGVKEQVGIYMDESVISLSLFTPDFDLFDLDRVETLRGPQGTLFGSGSVGGTIRYITKQPRTDRTEGTVEAGINFVKGGDIGYSAKGAINLPLSDTLAMRAVGYEQHYGGFIDAIGPASGKNVNDGDRYGGRFSLLFEPTPDIHITPRIIYQKVKANGFNRAEVYNLYDNPLIDPGSSIPERTQFLQLREAFRDRTTLADLTASFGLGGVELTSVTSYINRDILVSRDASALTGSVYVSFAGADPAAAGGASLPSNLRDTTKLKQWSQELRLASTGSGPFQWVFGGFYSHVNRKYEQRLPTPGSDFYNQIFLNAAAGGLPVADTYNGFPADSPYNADLPYIIKQSAIFGEASYQLDQFKLTAGARYYNFKETRDFVSGGVFSNGDTRLGDKTKSDGISPRFIVSYEPQKNLTFNVQAAKGFRLGGVNDPLNIPLCSGGATGPDAATFGNHPTYDDETLWNYEAGMKASTSGLTFSAAVFHNSIRNLQVTADAGSCSSRVVFNVPKAHSRGVEAELNYRLMTGLDFSLAGSIISSKFDSSVYSADDPATPVDESFIIAGIRDGNRLPTVPKFQGAATMTYTHRVMSNAVWSLTGSIQHVGSRFTQPGDQEAGAGLYTNALYYDLGSGAFGSGTYDFGSLTLPSYNLVNLSTGLKWDSGFEVVLYANNVFDKTPLLSLDRERGGRARLSYNIGTPRTIGLTLRKSFESMPAAPYVEPPAPPPPPAPAPATQTCADGSVILATDSCPLPPPPPPPPPAPERG